MSIAENQGRRPIHNRKIDMNTYEYDESAVLVEGRLTDNRFCRTYSLTGDVWEPGIVHDIIIQLVVRGPEPSIESIEVEMKSVPKEECLEMKHSLDPVAGMKIVPGFTEKVKAEVGGVNGCTHLVSLLLTMAPASIQGAWVAMAQQPIDPDIHGDRALQTLENTCWVWRSDGPSMQEFRNRMQKQK